MGGMMPPGGDMGDLSQRQHRTAPPPTGINALVEKYGYEWVDGVAYKPGTVRACTCTCTGPWRHMGACPAVIWAA